MRTSAGCPLTRWLRLAIAFSILMSGLVLAVDAPTDPLLPKQFGGWRAVATPSLSKDAGAADATDAPLLKEFGFTDFSSSDYTRPDGRKLTIKAARFVDATGAYGAFNYYKAPQMRTEEIGDQGASFNERVLFFRGNILIDARFDKLNAMSAAQLRELASALTLPGGGSRNPPSLAGYLPPQSRVDNSTKYVVGPIGLAKIGSPIPAGLVDFNAGAEVAQAKYKTSSGDATLMVISYPTPQIAGANLHRMDAAQQNAQAQAGRYFDRRTGPLVVVVAGSLSRGDAKDILSSVNYDADVTWNENTSFNKNNNVGSLLVNVIILCGILCGLALVSGIAFGGLRVLIRNVFPQRSMQRQQEVEFISLHLSEKGDPKS